MPLGPFLAQDQLAITTLGLEFAVAVALGTALGLWADQKWALTPWGTVIGVFLGFALAMYIVVRHAQRVNQLQTKGQKRDRSL